MLGRFSVNTLLILLSFLVEFQTQITMQASRWSQIKQISCFKQDPLHFKCQDSIINRQVLTGHWHYHRILVRVFANGLWDLRSILGRVIPKKQKMVLDATLLNTQHYKIRIKDKLEQSREKSSALPYTLV